MALNAYFGRDRKWLENELRHAQDDLSYGKVVTRAGSGDIMVQSEKETSTRQRIHEILMALNVISPEDYPIASITPATRTKIVFSS